MFFKTTAGEYFLSSLERSGRHRGLRMNVLKNRIEVVRVWLRGGLGNQLFQYAQGLALSKRTGASLEIRADLLPSEEDSYAGVNRWPEQISGITHEGQLIALTKQPSFATSLFSKSHTALVIACGQSRFLAALAGYPPEGEVSETFAEGLAPKVFGKSINLYGYFLDSKPAIEVGDQLRSQIRNAVSGLSDSVTALSAFEGKVVVHLRLGDHLSLRPSLRYEYASHLLRASRAVQSPDQSRVFTLVSDNLALAREIAGSAGLANIEEFDSSEISPLALLNLMGAGDGLIGGASTFAWWAGFLQEPTARKVLLSTDNSLWNESRLGISGLTFVNP